MAPVWIYHEPQESALCGQHCLNNLLQDSAFDPGTLADIAAEMYEQERRMMAAEGTATPEYQAWAKTENQNVDDQGNFSIQVLNAALERGFGVSLRNRAARDVQAEDIDVAKEEGFVCNRSSHWFTIRRINGRFWNLNSTFEVPEVVSDFFLGAFISTLQNDGYDVFVPRGNKLPQVRERGSGAQKHWHRDDALLTRAAAQPGAAGAAAAAAAAANRDPWADVGQGRMLSTHGNMGRGEVGALSSDARTAQALQASFDSGGAGTSEDAELAAAIALSMGAAQEAQAGPPPAEPEASEPDTCRVQFRWEGGRRVRRFRKADPATAVLDAVAHEFNTVVAGRRYELRNGTTPLSRAALAALTVDAAGLSGASVVIRLT